MGASLLPRLASLFGVTHLLFSPVAAANIQAFESKVLPRITQVVYQKLNLTDMNARQVPPPLCLTDQTEYRLKIASHDNKNLFRVPHARIFEDSKPCGDQAIPEKSLWVQDHMVLAPYWMMKSEEAAKEAGGDAIAMQFDFEAPWRGHLHKIASALEGKVESADIWVGYEAGDRVCDGKVAVKRGTFILFAFTPPDKFITEGEDNIRLGGITFAFQLRDPRKNDTNFNVVDTTYVYPSATDLHLYFREVQDIKGDYDMICPFALSEYQRAEQPLNSTKDTGSCFPADATLTKSGGSRVRMSDLRIGDEVLDATGKFTEIFLFTHRDRSTELHSFVELTTEDQNSDLLVLSPGHYAYISSGLIAASDIQIGSSLITADGQEVRVLGKRFVLREGLYNPQSISGSLVVNGFAVSTYTTAVQPSYANILLGPLRGLYRKSGKDSFIRQSMESMFVHGAGRLDWLVVKLLGVSKS